jgi:hypothetical protein
MGRIAALAAVAAVYTSSSVSAAPCDIYGSAGTPCVAAYSLVRALYGGYGGKLYQVTRTLDNATIDIGVLSAGGYADAAAQDAFCNTSSSTPSHVGVPPFGSIVNIVPVVQPFYSFRHCDAQGFITMTDNDDDHKFKLVAALNGAPNAVSLQSVNYPTYYVAPVAGAEPGRVGIVEAPAAGDASWAVASAPGGAITLTCLGAGRTGSLGVGTNLTGSCAGNYAPPAASVYLSSGGAGNNANLWKLSTLTPAACVVTRLYDQSPSLNHLDVAPPGGAHNAPDSPVNAAKLPITVSGHAVYGAYFEGGASAARVRPRHVCAEVCIQHGSHRFPGPPSLLIPFRHGLPHQQLYRGSGR